MGKFIKAFLLTLVVLVLASLVGVFYVGASVHHQDPLDLVTDLTSNKREIVWTFYSLGWIPRTRARANPGQTS